MTGALTAVLLIAGVVVVALASAGVLAARTALDRLHFVGLASTWGTALVGAAVLASQPGWQTGFKTLLLVVLIWCSSPLLSHVQASLAYQLEFDDVRSDPSAESGS
jgi:multisubunit Na+/H+ antiporter MnhG subunit